MATLTNTKIKDTYVGLLKTTDNQAIDASGVTLVEDGAGNASALSVGRSGNGVSVSGNLAVDTDTLYVNTSTSRIGINTNSPSQRLHILESDATAAYARISNSAGVFEAGIDASGNGEIGTATSDALILNTQGTERMRILASGEVGINTTPERRFHINSEGIQIGSLFESTSAISCQINLKNANSTNGGFIKTTGDNIILTANNTGATHLVVADGGFVGIGTSTQTANGEILRIAGDVFINSAGSASVPTIALADTNSGLFAPSAGEVAITTQGNERMRITSAGNVGIGVTSARSILETDGTISIFDSRNSVTTGDTLAGIEIYTDDVSYNPPSARANMPVNRILPVVETSAGDAFGMAFYTADTDADSVERMRIDSSGNVGIGTTPDSDAELHIYRNGNPARVRIEREFNPQLDLESLNGYAQIGTLNNFPLAFQTNGSERMRIASGGDVLINTTSGTGENKDKFVFSPSAGWIVQNHSTSRGDGSYFNLFYYGTTLIGSITQSGTTGVAYNTSSDYRLKENVVEMTGALDRVDALKPSRFNFIADPETTVDGFLAHEVAEVIPEAISGEKDAVDEEGNPIYQGIDQSKIVPLLVGAIQELRAEIELLKSQING